jgi:hypothetical protein
MKEYRLTGWPELDPPFHRTAHHRMSNDMSQRFMTVPQLAQASGLKRHEVRRFLQALQALHLLEEREAAPTQESEFWSLRPLGGWLRRAFASATHRD